MTLIVKALLTKNTVITTTIKGTSVSLLTIPYIKDLIYDSMITNISSTDIIKDILDIRKIFQLKNLNMIIN